MLFTRSQDEDQTVFILQILFDIKPRTVFEPHCMTSSGKIIHRIRVNFQINQPFYQDVYHKKHVILDKLT